MSPSPWPVEMPRILEAQARIRPLLPPTPCRHHPELDRVVAHGIRVVVKHEGSQPTGSFKVRNGLSALSALSGLERSRGVVAATRGNHGLGLAWAGLRLGVPVRICVPLGNSPVKNRALASWGAELVEEGRDYDDAVEAAARAVAEEGRRMVHSTNDRDVIAGAATLTLEMLQEAPEIEALVVAVGGGSQAAGALCCARALRPDLEVYGVQAAGAPAIHDSWHARRPLRTERAETIADGLATRQSYELTFPILLEGLRDLVTVTEDEILQAMRLLLEGAHAVAEPAGAAGFAGLLKLAPRLQGRCVGVILSGANVDPEVLARAL